MAWTWLAALLFAIIGSACTATIEAYPARSVHVAKPPPDPLPETKSGPPVAGMAWIPGYWHFNGTDYVWIPGHWESPRMGWIWRSPNTVYSRERRAWIYQHGRWEPSGGGSR